MAPKRHDEYGPWNPGIRSQLPREYLPLSTLFRRENVTTGVEQAHELSDFCGIPPIELVAFRAERLIVHELLIRVTADLSVPDGPNYEDLGHSFREMASVILEKYVAPHHKALIRFFDELRDKASARIAAELSKELFPCASHTVSNGDRRSLFGLFGFGESGSGRRPSDESTEDRARRVVDKWQQQSETVDSPFDRSCYASLTKVVFAITGKRGRLIGDKDMITSLAATMVCNGHGSEVMGEAIDPYFKNAVAHEGYRLLPRHDKPVVMNIKGASAAGKSTMRPLQRNLAEKLSIPWDDFARISPDIWRKFLLDYGSLGAAYKYAGTFTGHEVEIIDKKLDRYMAKKAASGKMSHLLIDRFRFDSFVPESDEDEASKLLTRFGDLVYLYFMITPPDATVERAWIRGEELGRYKAVDDLLDHNVEAYTGMPQLFFTWALRTKKRVHYEFLDNSVSDGCRPRTVAFGWNGEMNVLDIKGMLDIDRFRKININAQGPEDVYDDERMAPERNTEFLQQCARVLPVINFADCRTGQIYARLERGNWTWRDKVPLGRVLDDHDTRAGFQALGLNDTDAADSTIASPPQLVAGKAHTLGAWGADTGGLPA